MRDTAGSATAPVARRRKVRRGSFMVFPLRVWRNKNYEHVQFVGSTQDYTALIVHSIFNPSALTTGVQRATSAAREWRNFAGLESRVGSKPASINVCC